MQAEAVAPVTNGTSTSRARYAWMDKILSRPSPNTDAEWEAGQAVIDTLEQWRILVIGAGGLGCEILKNLALSGEHRK